MGGGEPRQCRSLSIPPNGDGLGTACLQRSPAADENIGPPKSESSEHSPVENAASSSVVPPTINEKGGADCNPAAEVDVQNYDQALVAAQTMHRIRHGSINGYTCRHAYLSLSGSRSPQFVEIPKKSSRREVFRNPVRLVSRGSFTDSSIYGPSGGTAVKFDFVVNLHRENA
jgi:hypothetical protein